MKLKRRSVEEDPGFGRRRPVAVAPPRERGRAFSYYAKRSLDETNLGRTAPREDAPRRQRSTFRRVISRAPIVIVGVAMVAALVWQLALSANPKIVVLTTPGENLFPQNTVAYHAAAEALFSGSLGNRNKLTVNAAGISAALKKQFSELSDVSVALPVFGSQPVVYVQPSKPTFVLSTSGGSYVLDSTGRAAAAAGNVPQSVLSHLQAIVDQSGLRPRIGHAVLPTTAIAFVQTVVAQLKAQHFGIKEIVLPKAASEVDVYISGKPYFVKFNLQDSKGALQQVGSYIAVSQYLSSRRITPSQYVDVRLDGRAYYK